LAETVQCQVSEVVIDVTHGFRHLPMLALVAARYLAHVRRVEGAMSCTTAPWK
jgi:CRISPR-associated DxTHG motif protein